MKSPFDGEISAYFKTNAPQDVRQALKGATKGVMLDPAFTHRNRLQKKPYQTQYDALQIELAKFQNWVNRLCGVQKRQGRKTHTHKPEGVGAPRPVLCAGEDEAPGVGGKRAEHRPRAAVLQRLGPGEWSGQVIQPK